MIRSLSIMLLSLLAVTFLSLAPTTRIPIINHAYGHFIGGETKTIGNYKVLFLISPPKPIVGDSSTKINFSILDKDQNKDIKSIFAALTIREKDSGKIVYKTPFRLYQFGDITFPYTFQNNTNYQLELQTKISIMNWILNYNHFVILLPICRKLISIVYYKMMDYYTM